VCCDTENALVLRQCPPARLPACPTARLHARYKKSSEGNDLCPYRFTNALQMRIVLWGALSFTVRNKRSNCSPRKRQKTILMQFSLSSEACDIFIQPHVMILFWSYKQNIKLLKLFLMKSTPLEI